MTSRYWIGDLHLGHLKVAQLRGFSTVVEHDHHLLTQLSYIHPDDTVWVMGDISSGKPDDEQRALELLATLGLQLHLIAGNHDSVSSIHRQGFKQQRRWLEVFQSVQQFGRIAVEAEPVLMSHYPYEHSGDGPGRGEARYSTYRLPDRGLPLLHAHTHQPSPHMSTEQGDDLQQLCTSWDSFRRPVTDSDVNEWIKKRRAAL